jgi:hypothetical protein
MTLHIYEDGEEIAQVDGEDISTNDTRLDTLFWQLMDEGVPVSVGAGEVRYEEADEKAIKRYLKDQGYDVSSQVQDAFPLGEREIMGFPIVIEHESGDVRYGNYLPASYGFIRQTHSAEGEDQMDVFVGTDTDAQKIYIIDSYDTLGKFDEHKIMFCFTEMATALACFRAYYDGSGPAYRSGYITEVSEQLLREWLAVGNLRAPYSQPTDVQYEPVAKNPNAVCARCDHAQQTESRSYYVCLDEKVQRDPRVPVHPTNSTKIVNSGAWCTEWKLCQKLQ